MYPVNHRDWVSTGEGYHKRPARCCKQQRCEMGYTFGVQTASRKNYGRSCLRKQDGRPQLAAPDQLVNELRIGPCRQKSTVGRSIQQRRARQPWSCSARGHRRPSVETDQQASATAPVKLTIHGARTLTLVCTPQSAERSPVSLRLKTLNVGLTLRQTKLPRDKASHTIRTSVRTWPKH